MTDAEVLADIRETVKDTSFRLGEMEKQFVAVLGRMDFYQTSCNECRASVQHSLTGLKHTVYGNGQVGLKMKVDRLEGAEARRAWTVRTLVAAVIAIVVKLATEKF